LIPHTSTYCVIVHLVLSSIAVIVEGSEFDISSCYANRTPR
jgi:hypothetical protein